MIRVRDDDERSDEQLADAGRRAYDLGLAVAWTSGIAAAKAKKASDSGSGAWKAAKPLPDREFAAALFVNRCRNRNPVGTAAGSGLVLLEVDGPLELLERHGIVLPPTVCVRSSRGSHFYYQPPAGRAPLKVQVSADGVETWSDGYLVLPPALHPDGTVYAYAEAPLWATV